MSLLSRLARPTPSVGRAYSSFFSSKPGGGRYFNSIQTSQTSPTARSQQSKGWRRRGNLALALTLATLVLTQQATQRSTPATRHTLSQEVLLLCPSLPLHHSPTAHLIPIHPSISSKEYKFHQFFSLHRPLLLLNQPASIIFDSADPSTPLISSSHADQASNQSRQHKSSPDADADAARQLAHTLVMNRVGGTQWVSIHADSTRRKRRKKMKKHKLKKRRRVS
ncbi:hypothetical protein BU15DRAFT_87788 [Melanogaster broomeanus]|nr:hypothetical protein BU15DRAFT_87788 [Melanogaster broomeanus]